MSAEPVLANSAEDAPPSGKRRKLAQKCDAARSTPAEVKDRARCRLFVGFPEGQLRDVRQATGLFPTATSIQLPRAVECQFESAAEAAAVAARLQAEVLAGRLAAAEVVRAERPAPGAGPRTVLRDMTRLHVRGIQRTVTVPELRELFAGCSDVTVPGNNARGNNGYAFVQFPDRESAAAFMVQQLKLQEKPLTLSYAVERDMKRAGEPNLELVKVDSDPGGKPPKQDLPGPPNGGAGDKPAVKEKKKWKHGKNTKIHKNDVYKNQSTVMTT
ncbi:uncharacterized protein LOC122369876 [Amphibalanus amphitrite]|uniref:uncharacterized protein LOC122369876 n=1 Tax=Amphibalanus amphitrite TaxID=1232801 RepID=UPI001C92B2CD|nr:uncharacterized protein LOC122369876 [Amphibalanus amphitrite]